MRGGKREGAGRKKGSAGQKTIARAERVKEVAQAIEQTVPGAFIGDSHDFLMTIYKDPLQPMPLRIDAAKAAIGYEKPKLAAVEHSGDKDNPLAFAVLSGVPSAIDADDDDQRPSAPSH